MDKNITRQQLLFWDVQYAQMRGTFQEVLLRTRINEYYRVNGVLITATKEKREALMNEFVAREENNTFKTEPDGEGRKFTMKEPIREKEFNDKMNELMGEIVKVEI